jgi:signal transduction histidine kinase
VPALAADRSCRLAPAPVRAGPAPADQRRDGAHAIAREIHDDVGGSLTALKFDLAWIGRHADDPAEVQQRVQSALETVTMRSRPASASCTTCARRSWSRAWWRRCSGWRRFERRTGIECAFRTSHDHLNLPPGVPLVAYRTAQEALTNVSKHAQATRVSIDLSLARGVLSLEISDNGRGLAPDDLAKARSFGIRGLHERASPWAAGSTCPAAWPGTTVILSVPLRRTAPGQ